MQTRRIQEKYWEVQRNQNHTPKQNFEHPQKQPTNNVPKKVWSEKQQKIHKEFHFNRWLRSSRWDKVKVFHHQQLHDEKKLLQKEDEKGLFESSQETPQPKGQKRGKHFFFFIFYIVKLENCAQLQKMHFQNRHPHQKDPIYRT